MMRNPMTPLEWKTLGRRLGRDQAVRDHLAGREAMGEIEIPSGMPGDIAPAFRQALEASWAEHKRVLETMRPLCRIA